MATSRRKLWIKAPGTLLLDQFIPDTVNGGFHPQPVDVYIPQGTIKACALCLHGASGEPDPKWSYSQQMLVHSGTQPTVLGTNWRSLSKAFGNQPMAVIFAKGGHCSPDNYGSPYNPNNANTVSANNPYGVATWNNHVMYSGYLDIDMIADAPAYIQSLFGSVARIYIGHSNGGMMGQRRWAEHVAGQFNVYCTSSGPFSQYYIDNPPAPAIPKPTLSIIGQVDTILNVTDGPNGPGDHFYDQTWAQAVAQTSVADVQLPTNWISEWFGYQTRVNAYNTFKGLPPQTILPSDGVVTNIAIGHQTKWTDQSGANVLVLLSASNHQVRSMQKVLNTGLLGLMAAFAFANQAG
jgi:hypothetical protein